MVSAAETAKRVPAAASAARARGLLVRRGRMLVVLCCFGLREGQGGRRVCFVVVGCGAQVSCARARAVVCRAKEERGRRECTLARECDVGRIRAEKGRKVGGEARVFFLVAEPSLLPPFLSALLPLPLSGRTRYTRLLPSFSPLLKTRRRLCTHETQGSICGAPPQTEKTAARRDRPLLLPSLSLPNPPPPKNNAPRAATPGCAHR